MVQSKPLKKSSFWLFKISFLLFFLTFSAQVGAQTFGETLDLTVSPKNPTPFGHVYMSVKSVVQDLNTKEVTWYLNGKVARRGIGEKSFEFDLGGLGSVSSVGVSAGGLSKNIDIRPTDVDLVWESDGFTPPFYKGKGLRAFQGNLRVIAIPHFITPQGTTLNPKDLIYSWYNGNILNASASGYGKNSLTYAGSVISRPLNIEVRVSSRDGSYQGGKEIIVEETTPALLIYEDHPLYGVLYNNALGGKEFSLKDREVKITAVPYFFSTKNKGDAKLKYSWSINGSLREGSNFKDSVIFRQEGNVAGLSSVSLLVENKQEFLQASRAAFGIRFEK